MKHLLLDSNIWLNLLLESGNDENPLDVLLFWIENNHIKILLPEIIVTEWNRNRQGKKDILLKDWKVFFNKAKKVFDKSYVNSIQTPEHLNDLVDRQLAKIDTIFEKHVISLKITDAIKLDATKLAEERKAPFHKKNSIADAYIYLVLVEFAELNPECDCFFITKNYEDFSSKSKSHIAHPDIEPAFRKYGIEYFTDLGWMMNELGKSLPSYSEYIKRKSLEKETSLPIHTKDKSSISDTSDSFIDNTSHLNLILKKESPSKHQINFVLDLIKSDEKYKEYFITRTTSFFWFNIFKAEGYFEAKHNPKPIKVDKGYQLPFWHALEYLEKLSLRISKGEHLDYAPEIITIITEISNYPSDNYRTWFKIIKIISNLPNNSIPLSLFDNLPTWLSTKFDSTLQSSELCQKLVPKFLNDSSTNEDLKKAEKLLFHIFCIKKTDKPLPDIRRSDEYYSTVKLYYIEQFLIKTDLIKKVGESLSIDIAYHIGDQIKAMIYGIYFNPEQEIEINGVKQVISASVEGNSLQLYTLPQNGDSEEPYLLGVLDNYENIEDTERTRLVQQGVEKKNINILGLEKALNGIFKSLHNVSSYISGSIYDLGNRRSHVSNVKSVFSLALREILSAKVKYNSTETQEILTSYLISDRYRLPFFKRIALYIIGENWTKELANIFFKGIESNDKDGLFSNYRYEEELYELLQKNVSVFSDSEKEYIKQIISQGKKAEDIVTEEKAEYWQLRWYAALKDDPYFSSFYDQLSKKLSLDNTHFENSRGMKASWRGEESPYSIEELLEMPNREIVENIFNFKPTDRWKEPSVGGFAGNLGKAVEQNPEKFASDLHLFKEVYYIYAYHIILGFRDAWKNSREFDWASVLDFCLEYITTDVYLKDLLSFDYDDWNATQDWVVGAIGNLIVAGTQNDNTSYNPELLPKTKEILLALVPKLQSVAIPEKSGMDYPTYSLNSTAGKVLRALLDYSLNKARRSRENKKEFIWEHDVKEAFDSTIKKGIIDPYILLGMYFPQFRFLDKEWQETHIAKLSNTDEEFWKAFIGGYIFTNPANDKDIFKLIKPLYEKSLLITIPDDSVRGIGLERHLAIYYVFFGFEKLEEDTLIHTFLTQSSAEKIGNMIRFVSSQSDFIKTLNTEEERELFRSEVKNFWKFILDRYKDSTDEDSQNLLTTLTQLLELFKVLDKELVELLLPSIPSCTLRHSTAILLEELVRFIETHPNTETPALISLIVEAFLDEKNLPNYDTKHIIQIIEYLYIENKKTIADKACNMYARNGHEFLRDLYDKYNN